MLALDHYRTRLLCPCGCGWPRAISLDPSTEFLATADAPSRCHVRTALVRAQKESERPFPEALIWSAHLHVEPVDQ